MECVPMKSLANILFDGNRFEGIGFNVGLQEELINRLRCFNMATVGPLIHNY